MIGKTRAKDRKKPIVLQPRDELIMILVTEFQLLSREQLQVLLDFPCTTRINIRLKKLYDHGYLSRLLLPTIAGKPKAMYFLGPQGVVIMSESQGVDALLLEKDRKHLQDKKPLFLNHQMFLNDVRIGLSMAIKGHPHMFLERWIRERDCFIEFPNSRQTLTALRPDGCLYLSYGGKRYGFFLEADCSTMTNGRLKAKAKVYLDYARSGCSLHDFGFQYFRVLIVTKTEERLSNLKTTIEEISDRIFFFTTKDQVCQSAVWDRIWQRAGSQGLFPLLEN